MVGIRIANASGAVFRPHDLDTQLLSCPEFGRTCTKRRGTPAEEPQMIPVGATAVVVRYLDAHRPDVESEALLGATHKAQQVKFAGPPCS